MYIMYVFYRDKPNLNSKLICNRNKIFVHTEIKILIYEQMYRKRTGSNDSVFGSNNIILFACILDSDSGTKVRRLISENDFCTGPGIIYRILIIVVLCRFRIIQILK